MFKFDGGRLDKADSSHRCGGREPDSCNGGEPDRCDGGEPDRHDGGEPDRTDLGKGLSCRNYSYHKLWERNLGELKSPWPSY